MISGDAVVYTGGLLDSDNAKTAHGLIRAGTRFNIVGIIDEQHAGHSIGTFMPDASANLPICADIVQLLKKPGKQATLLRRRCGFRRRQVARLSSSGFAGRDRAGH